MAERWHVSFHPAFDAEFQILPEAIQDEVAALAEAIAVAGPQLGRPRVDTLKGSKHANMKEGRFKAEGGVWRVAFAFDPERKAVLLVGGAHHLSVAAALQSCGKGCSVWSRLAMRRRPRVNQDVM